MASVKLVPTTLHRLHVRRRHMAAGCGIRQGRGSATSWSSTWAAAPLTRCFWSKPPKLYRCHLLDVQ